MVFVKVRDAEHLEEALKRFKRECEKNGILREIKRRETYTPPSVKRKIKSPAGPNADVFKLSAPQAIVLAQRAIALFAFYKGHVLCKIIS